MIPIEVKSGATGRLRSRSLHQFMDQAEHGFAVRLYAGKLEVEGKAFKLLNLPYYLGGKVEEYLEWFSN